ncbi:MAG: VOC family protein, partial [Bryobacteraceae bacterium]
TVREAGKFMDGPRVSSRIAHLGIIVGNLDAAMKFYGGILGLTETWRGSKDGKVLNWVNMKLPDSNDYLEFMLYDQTPNLGQLGTFHHICLEVPDIDKAKAQLESSPARAIETRPMEIKTGTNRKRQMNLYDPDGTRSELMEPKTIDGKPTPSSTAKPAR